MNTQATKKESTGKEVRQLSDAEKEYIEKVESKLKHIEKINIQLNDYIKEKDSLLLKKDKYMEKLSKEKYMEMSPMSKKGILGIIEKLYLSKVSKFTKKMDDCDYEIKRLNSALELLEDELCELRNNFNRNKLIKESNKEDFQNYKGV